MTVSVISVTPVNFSEHSQAINPTGKYDLNAIFVKASMAVLAVAILTVAIVSIFTGLLFRNDCPVDRRIPIWLFVNGLTLLCVLFIIV